MTSGCDEETLLAASLSFALHFEEPEKAQFTEIPEEECGTEYDTTIEEEEAVESQSNTDYHANTQTQITDSSQSVPVEAKPIQYEFGPEESFPVPELVIHQSESEGIVEPRRTSSRLLFQRLHIASVMQPTVVSERSEEEVETRQEKRQKAARLAAKCKKQRKEVERAIHSTLRTFGSSAPSSKSKTGNSLIQSWRDMHRITCSWLIKLYQQEALRKSTFFAFFLNSVHALRKTMCTARPRPPEVHDLVLRFIVDFNKIHEIAQIRGIQEVAGSVGRLVESCLGKFLASPQTMHSMSLSWLQTKEVIEMMFSVANRTDTIYGLLQLLSRIQSYFLRVWADQRDRKEEFIAYAVSQIQAFSSILSGRLVFIANKNKYSEI